MTNPFLPHKVLPNSFKKINQAWGALHWYNKAVKGQLKLKIVYNTKGDSQSVEKTCVMDRTAHFLMNKTYLSTRGSMKH